MRDVMIDLETAGTAPGSVILSIGAVGFDPGEPALGPEFYKVVNVRDSQALGMTVEFGTMAWWARQTVEAQRVLRQADAAALSAPPRVVLEELTSWLSVNFPPSVRVWGNGAAFDNVLLQEMYRTVGLAAPWSFYNDRCYRTLKELRPDVKMVRGGTHHNALDDARSQAEHAVRIIRAMVARPATAPEETMVPAPQPVDRTQTTLVDGTEVTADHRKIDPGTGMQKSYVVLSAEERARGFVRPVRSAYVHAEALGGCGAVTRMGPALAETYARDPSFYSGTFCCGCGKHFPVGAAADGGQFLWDDAVGEAVGT